MTEILDILKMAAPVLIPATLWYSIAAFILSWPKGSKRRYKGSAGAANYVYRRDGNILYRRQKVWGRSRR